MILKIMKGYKNKIMKHEHLNETTKKKNNISTVTLLKYDTSRISQR
jgi:hypothetical protein